MSKKLFLALGGCLALSMMGCSDDAAIKLDTGSKVDTGSNPDMNAMLDVGLPTDMIAKGDQGSAPDTGHQVDAGSNDASSSTAQISGFVENDETRQKIAGAKVSVVGASPPNSTTTDAKGLFTLSVKANITVFLKAEKTSFISSIVGLVAAAGAKATAEFGLFQPSMLDSEYQDAGMGKRDPSKGIASVIFNNASSGGGEGASLSAGNAGSYTLDAKDDAVKSAKLLPKGDDSLMFVNVTTGQTTVTLSATKCKLTHPTITSYPIQANTLTDIVAICTP